MLLIANLRPDNCMKNTSPLTFTTPGSERVTGAILVAVAALEGVAMAHHPTVGSHDYAGGLRELGAMAGISGLVHGTLMVMMLVVLHGLIRFALGRGLHRPLIHGGLLAYLVGVLGMLAAALASGFIAPALALHLQASGATEASGAAVLLLPRLFNQALAEAAVVVLSIGIALWSIDLLRDRGLAQAAGVLGCVVAILPLAGFASGLLHLNVAGMSAVVLVQALWTAAIGVLLYRGLCIPRQQPSEDMHDA